MYKKILWGLASILFVLGNGYLWWQHQTVPSDPSILLALTPLEVSSPLEGQYFQLHYELSKVMTALQLADSDGYLVLAVDAHKVASFVRITDQLAPNLPAGQIQVFYEVRQGQLYLDDNAFFFDDGQADHYRHARYGEFVIHSHGKPELVALRDGQFHLLGENSP